MDKYQRTVSCGDLRAEQVGQEVWLNGWVHRLRNHGAVHFLNIRDRYGVTQCVVDTGAHPELVAPMHDLRMEFCIAVKGIVRARPDEMVNKNMPTGAIEVDVVDVKILNECAVLPFMIDEKTEAREDLRLQYRYLDLRSGSLQYNLRKRSEFSFAVREFYTGEGFLELETPTFIRSTPEGARDFLVPSRRNPGLCYALPQSPQLYKQLLMVSGFDKYFQIARCYRDEDARGDRQLEFTQIDVERSFVSRDQILEDTERMLKYSIEKTFGGEVQIPFPRLSYHEAMNLYGSDKPDTRFGLEMQDFAAIAAKTEFGAFTETLEKGGAVKILVVAEGDKFSRKGIDELEKAARTYGAKGLAWTKVQTPDQGEGFAGGVAKFLNPLFAEIVKSFELKGGELLLMVADSWRVATTALGAVRLKVGAALGLQDPMARKFLWVVDFPMFEEDEENGGWQPAHHMFTMPQDRFIDTMEENPGEVLGDLYDLVLNGNEVASGSIRIHDPEIQQRVFSIVGFDKEEAKRRFGFMLDAFKYGAPPHGGIAPGLDRMVMILCGEASIKEVIAFPKNTMGVCPMVNAPASVDEDQLAELHMAFVGIDKE